MPDFEDGDARELESLKIINKNLGASPLPVEIWIKNIKGNNNATKNNVKGWINKTETNELVKIKTTKSRKISTK